MKSTMYTSQIFRISRPRLGNESLLLVVLVNHWGNQNRCSLFCSIRYVTETMIERQRPTIDKVKQSMAMNRTMKRSRRMIISSGSGIGVLFFLLSSAAAFLPKHRLTAKLGSPISGTNLFETKEGELTENQSIATENPEVQSLKSELVELADRTKRGFVASAADKRKANEIVQSLQRLQTIPDPAKSYYDESAISSVTSGETDDTSASISGKWTLIYTDAPDITGLDTSRNPFSTAKLGRIGQECDPPYIKNVIEWVRPDWAKDLPFSGSDESRILQKVVTSGTATPSKPTFVDLKVAGLELMAGESNSNGSNVVETIQSQGIPAGLLSINPVDLKGPLNPPFGRFEILYLDEEFRAIKTSQNFLAVNKRCTEDDEWF